MSGSYLAQKLKLYALVQKVLLIGDLILTLLAENQRHIFYVLAGCYGVQFVLLVANIILLFVLFTNTYAFKAGVVQIMIKEFRGPLIMYGVYAVVFLVTRAYGAVSFKVDSIILEKLLELLFQIMRCLVTRLYCIIYNLAAKCDFSGMLMM
jgi:hypothetical protein